jgi:hypothetical protein
MIEMKTRKFKPLARLGNGVFMLLAVIVSSAPVSVWAGCSHLVASRTEARRLPSLIDPLMDDLSGRADPLQAPQRPCTGAWCSGQPATPTVPAGVFDWGLGSWAWWTSNSGTDSTSSSSTTVEIRLFHPLYCGNAVFHPPRRLPPA